MSAGWEIGMTPGDDPKDRRVVGGYLWRETCENAQQICLDLLVDENSPETRRKLRRLYELLTDLSRAKEQRGHDA